MASLFHEHEQKERERVLLGETELVSGLWCLHPTLEVIPKDSSFFYALNYGRSA